MMREVRLGVPKPEGTGKKISQKLKGRPSKKAKIVIQYDLQGNLIKKGYADDNKNTVSWPTTLISDKSRVFKGGSWKDRAYWLASGNRRFLDEDKSTATLGFRCAMDRLGSSRGLQSEIKNAKRKKAIGKAYRKKNKE